MVKTGTDRKFVIAPQNVLTANLKGFQLNLCRSSGDQSNAASFENSRTCNPISECNFVTGDGVDFTFGFSSLQSGILFYSIDP